MFPFLLALLVLPLSTQTPTPASAPAGTQTTPVTAESLIPANAFAVIRIRSLDALEKSVQAIVPGAPVGQELLGGLMMASQVPLPIDQIDRTAPLLVAACPSQVRPPVEPMLILTCKDPAAFTAPLTKAGWTCTTNGKLVACSPSKPGPALSADAPMRMGLDRNDVVLRIAMEQVMSQYGEVLKAGLDQGAEEAAASIPEEGTADSVSSMISGIGETLDQIEIFEINLSQRGNQTRLGFEMTALKDSGLAKVAKVDASALPTAARVMGNGAAVSMVGLLDFAKLMNSVQGFMDMATKQMPEDQRANFTNMMSLSKELYADMGTTIAGSYDFDDKGMHGATWFQPKDAAGYMTKMTAMLKATMPWMPMTGPEHAKVDGTDVSTYHFKFDLDKMPGMSAAAMNSTPEDKDKTDKAMAAMFGPDGMTVQMAPVQNGLAASIGSLDDMKATIARMSGKSPSPLGAELLGELGSMNPGLVMRMDMGRYMSTVGGLMSNISGMQQESMTEAMDILSKLPALQVAGGVDGRVWKLGLSTDVGKFVQAINSMKDMAPKTGEMRAVSAVPSTRTRAKLDIKSISNALDAYALNNTGDYPDSLEVLVKPDVNGQRYFGKDKLPLDPWGHAYVYTKPGAGHPQPRVASLGADGKTGGTGEDADIDNKSEDGDDR